MSKRRLKVAALMMAVLLAVVVFIAMPHTSAPLPVTVVFTGHTNDAAGIRVGVFSVANDGEETIRRWCICQQEFQKQPGLQIFPSLGLNAQLKPGESETVSIPAPTNQEPWRIVIHCSKDGWRMRFSDWMGRGSGGLLQAVVPKSLRGIPTQSTRSDWVDE